MCMHVLCVTMGFRGCMEDETVPQMWAGQAVMMDQKMTPGCPVWRVGQPQLQQGGSSLAGPVAVRTSGERHKGWRCERELEDREACPRCLRRRKRDDLWPTGSAENQS